MVQPTVLWGIHCCRWPPRSKVIQSCHSQPRYQMLYSIFFFAATCSKRHKNQWDHDHGRLIMVPFLVDERCRCHPLPCQQYSGANDTSPMAFSLTLGGVGRYLCPPPIDSQSFGPLSAQRGDWHHKCGSTPHNCRLLFCKNKCCQFWNLFTI